VFIAIQSAEQRLLQDLATFKTLIGIPGLPPMSESLYFVKTETPSVLGCGPCCARIIAPTAAQRFVKRNQVGRHGAGALDQGIFRSIERPLAVQHVEKIDLSLGVKLCRQLHGLSVGADRLNQRLAVLRFLCRGNQRIFDPLQSSQDCLAIADQRLLLQCLLLFDVGSNSA
jgi:hypothetical protein